MSVAPNQPPQVALTAPQADQLFVAPATVKLAADAVDADGKVVKLVFYQGGTLLGTATQAPYAYDWKDVPVGRYSITAEATEAYYNYFRDNHLPDLGQYGQSDPIGLGQRRPWLSHRTNLGQP